jgi:hypothetical protein
MKYHVYPNSRDGVWLATRPEPIHLSQVGYEISSFLTRFKQQGYFSNCRQEHLSLDTMEFRILPASVDPYEKEQTIHQKVAALWAALSDNEKNAVRFGLFPREKMAAAEKEGYDGHELAIALMDCATKDGGMRG